MPIPSDAYRASAAPLDADTRISPMPLTDADAEIALPSGVYELRVFDAPTTAVVFLALGSSAASVAAAVAGGQSATGICVAPGDVVSVFHDATRGDGKLHGALSEPGTARLLVTRKAGA